MHPAIRNSDGTEVKIKMAIKYLGCTLHQDGQMLGELKQKLACARNEFNQLSKVWNHTAVTTKVKRSVYQQCILNKLFYGLESVWFNKRE